MHVWKNISLASWSETARKIGSSLRYLHWAQQSHRAGKGEEKEGDFDLFIASPNQLQRHWTALTLISFCSTSPLDAFILVTSIWDTESRKTKKFLLPHSSIKQRKRQFQIGVLAAGVGVRVEGACQCIFPFPLAFIQKAALPLELLWV